MNISESLGRLLLKVWQYLNGSLSKREKFGHMSAFLPKAYPTADDLLSPCLIEIWEYRVYLQKSGMRKTMSVFKGFQFLSMSVQKCIKIS